MFYEFRRECLLVKYESVLEHEMQEIPNEFKGAVAQDLVQQGAGVLDRLIDLSIKIYKLRDLAKSRKA